MKRYPVKIGEIYCYGSYDERCADCRACFVSKECSNNKDMAIYFSTFGGGVR